jgi:hypothetical protein
MTKVQVIDLCGREAPYVIDVSNLELPNDSIDFILDQFAEGKRSAYIGEIEYRDVS